TLLSYRPRLPADEVKEALAGLADKKRGHLPRALPLRLPERDGRGCFEAAELVLSAGEAGAAGSIVPTLRLPMVFFTSRAVPPDVMQTMTREVVASLPTLAETVPMLAGVDPVADFRRLPIPAHEGVLAYLAAEGLPAPEVPVTEERSVVFAGGPAGRAGFAAAGTVARLLSQAHRRDGLVGVVAPSETSGGDMADLAAGRVAFALVSAERVHQAYGGEGAWAGAPQEQLRTVCTLYVAPLTLVCGTDTIEAPRHLSQLEGQRVSLPVPEDTGYRENAISLFALDRFREGLRRGYIINPEEPPVEEAVDLYVRGQIEAFFCTESHPSNLIMRAVSRRPSRIMAVTGLHRIVSQYPYYTVTSIATDQYPSLSARGEVGTVGVPVNLVASAATPDAVVTAVLDSLVRNASEVSKLNSSLPAPGRNNMLQGLTAPLHPAAEQIFRKLGYLEDEGARHKKEDLFVGTGSPGGVFYPVGSALASIINTYNTATPGFRLAVEPTGGSIDNVRSVASGARELGLVETSTLLDAYNGRGLWEDNPQTQLRSLCTLHMGYLMCIAGADTGIRTVLDLPGKRVNISNPGSGTRDNVDDLMNLPQLAALASMDARDQEINDAVDALRAGSIDALFYNVGLDSKLIYQVLGGERRMRFVAIPPEVAKAFRAANPGYFPVSIPVDRFPRAANEADVPTVGNPTVLVTSTRLAEERVERILSILLEHFDEVQQSHPALGRLTPAELVRHLVIPLHPGAKSYYDTLGLDAP
ncbi:MAG: TAXI family TRAP transporter solute-binding subunit, partial [Planctomycetota bacterium]